MDEKIRILCVDDEKNVLKSIERLFIDTDYDVITAISSEEGLNIMEEIAPIQIVISDYRMPGMNGVDFLQKVRKRWPDTIRIVLSGYADTGAVVAATNEGQIYKFMPKPWDDDELKFTISAAIEKYYLYKKNIQLAEDLKKKNEELKRVNENLERLVSERTSELVFQNKVLAGSQNILDALPIAVLGVDLDGMVVLCNQKGIETFDWEDKSIIGQARRTLLPAEINTFIDEIVEKGPLTEQLVINNSYVRVKGRLIKQSEGQEGVVLVLDVE